MAGVSAPATCGGRADTYRRFPDDTRRPTKTRPPCSVTLAVLALALAATPLSAQGDAAPAQPTGLTTEAAHDAVQLRWDDPGDGGITHYQVLRRDRGVHKVGEFVTIEDNTGSAATTYTDHSVEPETRYVYRVQAVNAHGVSRWSSFARANTPALPAPEPTPTPAPSPAPTPEPSPAPTPEPSPAPPAAPESTPAPTPEPETTTPSAEQVCELPAESQPTGRADERADWADGPLFSTATRGW